MFFVLDTRTVKETAMPDATSAVLELIRSGGPVVVAIASLAIIILGSVYVIHRYIWLPGQRNNLEMARITLETARLNKEASEAARDAASYGHQTAQTQLEMSKVNVVMTGENARTTENLRSLMDTVIQALTNKQD